MHEVLITTEVVQSWKIEDLHYRKGQIFIGTDHLMKFCPIKMFYFVHFYLFFNGQLILLLDSLNT